MHSAQPILACCPVDTVPVGTVLLQRSVASDSVLFIERGRVAIGVKGQGNTAGYLDHPLGFVDGPGWLETTAAVLNVPSAVDAVALTEVQLRRLPLAEFQANLDTTVPIVKSMLRDISRSHRQQTEQTVSRRSKDAQARCAEWLLSQSVACKHGGSSFRIQENKRDIAAQLGIVPETLSRLLTQMRDQKLISGRGRLVDILDTVGLQKLAGMADSNGA
jgi:CRP-like cAMP-binding protein